MPRNMCCQVLLNHAEVGDFFEVAVHLLVAGDGEQDFLLLTRGGVGVLAEDGQGDVEQGDVAHVLRLLAGLTNPEVAVGVFHDVFGSQLLHVDEGKAGEGSEDEDVADYGDALQQELLVIDGEQFVHRQELTDDFFLVELDADERVFGHPLVGEGEVGDFLQALHVADDRVLLTFLLGLEVKLEGTHQFAVDLGQRQVLLIVSLFDKFCEITLATFIAADGNQGVVLAHEGAALVVVLLHGADDGADGLGLFVLPEEAFLQDASGDELALLLHLVKHLVEFDSCFLDVGIQVAGFTALALGTFLRLVPQGRVNALADVVFHSRTVHGDAHTHGGFSALQQFGFLEIKKHIE